MESESRGGSLEETLAGYVARMAKGDQGALSSLYDATVGQVYTLALRILENIPEAEEVTADLYFTAWHSAPTHDAKREGVQTWLMRLCRTRALELLNRRAQDLPAQPGELQDLYAALQEGSRLRESVARLSPLQRQLLALALFRGYSSPEISAFTAIPLESVDIQLVDALHRIHTGKADDEDGK